MPQSIEVKISIGKNVVNIYVLKLKQRKYYVGKTDHTFQRFNQHMKKNGAKWTKKYPVVDLYDFHRGMKASDENRITREMMRKFGVANVRGGSWTKVNMTKSEIGRLEAKLKQKTSQSTKKCARCGRDSHTKSKCYARTHKNGSRLRSKRNVSPDSYAKLLQQQALAKKSQIEANNAKRLAEEAKNVNDENSKRISQLEEENSLLREELESIQAASKQTDLESMIEVLQLISEDDIAFLTDVIGTGIASVGKMAKKATKSARKEVGKVAKKAKKTGSKGKKIGKGIISKGKRFVKGK